MFSFATLDIVPFAGVLLSFALLPGFAPRFWEREMTTISLGWVALNVLITALLHGPDASLASLWSSAIADFLPFIALLAALYALGGGILIEGGPWGRPSGNLLLLAVGTVLAAVMGTIGAALLLIHPLLNANAQRAERRHLILAFIILVANVGGALTPLGDPPLLVGFLRGVPFFWPTTNLLVPMLVITIPVLALTWLADLRLSRRAPLPKPEKLRIRGGLNIVMLLIFVIAIAAAGFEPGPTEAIWAAHIAEAQIALTVFSGIVTAISMWRTPNSIRSRNRFAWEPMREISVLFFAIFTTIDPVLHDLAAAPLGKDPAVWFWLSGLCSAFLDSTPTYLMFFQAAGGNAQHLIQPPATLLRALSAGAVFFGALTYLGNAPNLMIRAIASRRGVRMPGFGGYLLAASVVLVPLFALETVVFFW